MFEDLDGELKQRIDSLMKQLEDSISRGIESDDRLSEIAIVLHPVPGIGPVASTMQFADLPQIGANTGEEATALTSFPPVTHESGTLPGKRTIAATRRALRRAMFQPALAAAHHNPIMRPFAECPPKIGKPHKVIITPVARNLVTIANALCKHRQKWAV